MKVLGEIPSVWLVGTRLEAKGVERRQLADPRTGGGRVLKAKNPGRFLADLIFCHRIFVSRNCRRNDSMHEEGAFSPDALFRSPGTGRWEYMKRKCAQRGRIFDLHAVPNEK